MTGDTFHTYTYDAEGNIVSVDGAAQYVYDAFSMRAKTTSENGTVMHYAYNPSGQRVSTWGVNGNLVTANYYANGHPIAYYSSTDGYLHFEHQDWEGTERMRTNHTGSVEGSYASLPFGDAFNASGTDTDPYHFAGLDHDADSDTEHADFRQYSSAQGRWLSPDPSSGSYDFGNPQSLDCYVYVLNNPLSLTDPKGLGGCQKNADDGAPVGSPDDCENPRDIFSGGELQGTMSLQQLAELQGLFPPPPTVMFGTTESVTVNGDAPDAPVGNTGNLGMIPYIPLQTMTLPARAPSDAQIIRGALKQKRLHACSQTLFGNANALTAANAPGIQYLSPSQMSAYLGGYLGDADAAGANNPAKNTVYFNSSVFKGNLPSIYYQSNYLHEAGNIISFNLYGNETARGNRFVGPNEYPVDPDSGASFERCIFGQRMQIP